MAQQRSRQDLEDELQHMRRELERLRGPQGTVGKAHPEGMAEYYDDSWLQALQHLQQGGGIEDFMPRLLAGFKGKPKHLRRFLHQARPFIAASMFKHPSFREVTDVKGRTSQSLARAMQGYGVGAGQISAEAERGRRLGEQRLGRMGLGRGASRAALAGRAAQRSGEARSRLFTDLYQGHLERSDLYAQQALDSTRAITQMMLGVFPTERVAARARPTTDEQLMNQIRGIGGGIGGILGGLF